jgi:hypothetical protein
MVTYPGTTEHAVNGLSAANGADLLLRVQNLKMFFPVYAADPHGELCAL